MKMIILLSNCNIRYIRTFGTVDIPKMRYRQLDDKVLVLVTMETVLMWMLGKKKKTLY